MANTTARYTAPVAGHKVLCTLPWATPIDNSKRAKGKTIQTVVQIKQQIQEHFKFPLAKGNTLIYTVTSKKPIDATHTKRLRRGQAHGKNITTFFVQPVSFKRYTQGRNFTADGERQMESYKYYSVTFQTPPAATVYQAARYFQDAKTTEGKNVKQIRSWDGRTYDCHAPLAK